MMQASPPFVEHSGSHLNPAQRTGENAPPDQALGYQKWLPVHLSLPSVVVLSCGAEAVTSSGSRPT